MTCACLRVPDPGALSVPTVCVFKCTFFCFSLLPLKHLLLWRQGLLQELHVKLILLLHFLLLPETHLVAYIALEAKAQRDHWVANTTETDINRRLISLLSGQKVSWGQNAHKLLILQCSIEYK